jgi:hypothetical protein
MLTERAQSYLNLLERLRPVPTRQVEKVLRDQGSPCFQPWLDFHERYAGYVEPLGLDRAIWGIVHEQSRWIEQGSANVDREIREETWYVTCAEVHPSYNYLLDNKGEFLGDPAESFDIKVERNALRREFFSGRGVAARVEYHPKGAELIDRLRRDSRLIEEASDSFFRYFRGDDFVAIEDPDAKSFCEAWMQGEGIKS